MSSPSDTATVVHDLTDDKGAQHPATDTFKADHRRLIRTAEILQVLPLFPPGGEVLEIGAGAGWQAKLMADQGFKVTAIDVETSNYNGMQVWPVLTYDGATLPFADASFDVVFSSNVLEHIPHIREFQREMARVLRPGGIAVHIMPTPTWRTGTTLSFFFKRAVDVVRMVTGQKTTSTSRVEKSSAGAAKRSTLSKVRKILFAPVHGVRGNLLSETYYFSSSFWTSLFRDAGWQVTEVRPCGIFYTGNRVLGHAFPLSLRKAAATCVGSSCKAYLLRRPPEA